MEKFVISGGHSLNGKVDISSAKNSVLPLVAASIMHEGKTFIEDCPKIYDVFVMMKIIENLGGKAYFDKTTLVIDTTDLSKWELPEKYTKEIRASLFMVGALLSRFGYASIYAPGGCNIGARPIDIHIDSLSDLGVSVTEGQTVVFSSKRKTGGVTTLRFKSVGATENAMMAAVLFDGTTCIKNVAQEPEIVDLQNYLNLIGAKISGAGSDEIIVEGVNKLKREDVRFRPVKDRVEAGTFLLAGAVCGGEMAFDGESLENSDALIKIIENNACKVYRKNGKIECVKFFGRQRGYGRIIVEPYPAFPTDLQPQTVAAATFADGLTVIEERVFKERFGYVGQLLKTGADVSVFDNACVVSGKADIFGADMAAGDLRGGAAMMIQALGAEGTSTITGLTHIDRGYERPELKFKNLGANIERIYY